MRCSPRSRQRSCCSPSPRAPAVSHSGGVMPVDQSLYPRVKTYPSIVVVENLDRRRQLAGGRHVQYQRAECLPMDRLPGFRDLLGGERSGSAASVPCRIRRCARRRALAAFECRRFEYRIDPHGIGALGISKRSVGRPAATTPPFPASRAPAVSPRSSRDRLTGRSRGGARRPDQRHRRRQRTGELSPPRPLPRRPVSCEARPPAVRALPLFHVDDSNPPFFVGHSLDESIPLSQSPRLARALREHSIDSTFVTVKSRWAANLSARSGWTPRR